MSSSESQIERLEIQIEELAGSIRQSQKLILIGRLSAAAGVLALVVFALSSTSLSLAWLMTAVALALGGLVLTGASKSSTDELQRALTKAQMDRTTAIDALNLKEIEG
ncbi:MAG: hypothetical protein JWO64_3277 [Hyphomicrobiales bacterium]|nr:hypothetical protein [Hyphomicrobiales bacterium]